MSFGGSAQVSVTNNVVAMAGVGHLSNYGRALVTQSTYCKGKGFIGAALLLRQKGGYEFVVLHLPCQGVEVVFKAMLMHKDYMESVQEVKEGLWAQS